MTLEGVFHDGEGLTAVVVMGLGFLGLGFEEVYLHLGILLFVFCPEAGICKVLLFLLDILFCLLNGFFIGLRLGAESHCQRGGSG